MTAGGIVRVERVVEADPTRGRDADYVDAFDLVTDEPLGRTVEELARVALEQTPRLLPASIRFIHRHVLRFDLAPPSRPGHLLCWRIVESSPDRLRLETSGPLMAGTITVEARDAATTRLTTALVYRRPQPAAAVWAGVGPIHRAVAPRLMTWAARTPAR